MRGFIISLLLLSVIVFKAEAQDMEISSERFVYGIENVKSHQQISNLERNMLALSFISEIKFEVKLDNGTARLEFMVSQPENDFEGRENIDMAEIKRLIIAEGLTPIECTKVN